ncbi:hypothetical protein EGI22_09035 [Lacihabitans sp. LS3-19]|uniref:outer membrane beta-barrel protein n=1 Tax=Lacihabitans sp. LS3-19 TaxID=2487335 RepID=UPI0020CCF643|nr:outer membrane beta-barrel protein [Lacihabitans sp. LS3-19]MCP9768056.1 hypothetical protein [Lacihabitans sp. LS3-19]
MSENNFDNNIRKKLESIRPEYEEAAWKKLKRSMPIPWYLSFMRDYGGWMFGGIATVAFLGTQYNNQTIKKENKLLNDKISTISNIPALTTVTDTVYIYKNDTIYATQYVTKYVKVGDEYAKVEPFGTESRGIVGVGSKKDLNKEEKALKDGKGLSKSENADLRNLAIESDTQPEMDPNTSQSKLISDAGEKTETKELAKAKENAAEDVGEEKLVAEELIIPEKKVEAPTEPSKEKKLNLKSINARFGVSADYMGTKFKSMGPAVEIFLGDRFALNTGLLITGKNQFDYRLPKDFNSGTGKQFEERYRPYVGGKPETIENIKIETSSIKLPLYFTYYVPVKYNLSFMMSTGTKLDLSVLESVSYVGRNFAGNSSFIRFDNQYKPKVFNSWYYGMGIQYQYKRFAGQLSPYFEFPFRQASYLVPPKRFGLNASLKFSLKK